MIYDTTKYQKIGVNRPIWSISGSTFFKKKLNEQKVLKLEHRVDEEGWTTYNWETNKLRNKKKVDTSKQRFIVSKVEEQ